MRPMKVKLDTPVNWQKDEIVIGCLNCGGGEMLHHADGSVELRLNTELHPPGVHAWSLSMDGEGIALPDKPVTVRRLNELFRRAKRSLEGAILRLDTPLRGAVYQRQGRRWLLVGTNEGYA